MKQIDEFLARNFKKIFVILTGIFLILYLMLLDGDYIWSDDAYTFAMIKHPFSEIWKITAADVHPPLYYCYLKIIAAPFKYSMEAAKIASILPYMFIIVFGGKQIKEYINERTAILFMGLFFYFPFALSYSIEVRMYSLASAFVFSCAFWGYKFWRSHGEMKNIAGFVISGVFAAYTHYFAFVSICIIYGLLFIAILFTQKNLCRKWLLSVVASIILYAPWLSSFISQLIYKVDNEYWIGEITVRTLLSYVKDLFGASGFALYAFFFSVSYLVCLIWILHSKEKKRLCCAFVAFLFLWELWLSVFWHQFW